MEIKAASRMQQKGEHFLSEQQEDIQRIEKNGESVINLGRGNPDQSTFEPVIETLKKAVDIKENSGYPPYGGKRMLKKAIIRFYKQEYNVKLSMDEVTIFNGSLCALTALPMVLINPQEVTLVPNPSFFGYETGVRMADGETYAMPLTEKNDYLPDLDEIPQSILQKSKLMFLNYPNNPTGAGANAKFFNKVVKFAQKNDIVIAHDFAYADISFKQKAPSFLQAKDAKKVGIEIYTMSKIFNMAGWRIAFAVGNRQVIHLLKDYIQSSVGGTFGAIQDAVEENLNTLSLERKNLQKLYNQRRKVAIEVLKNGNIKLLESEGTFFIWVKLPKKFKSDEKFAHRLLIEKNVAVVPGSVFGVHGNGYIRISLVSDLDNLREGLNLLVSFIKNEGGY